MDILAKMLINKNEVKASEGEEDVELVDDVQIVQYNIMRSQLFPVRPRMTAEKTSERHYRLLPKD